MSKGFLTPEQILKSRALKAEAAEEVSSVEADEAAYDALKEQQDRDTFLEQSSGNASTSTSKTVTAAHGSALGVSKDAVMVEVEKILEANLGEYVQALPEEVRVRFERKGEEVAEEIAKMIRDVRIQVKRVLHLIRDWLLSLPGMNKFFLEQEAKIKTDRMLELERMRREDPQTRS